jgi:hypothetical protein
MSPVRACWRHGASLIFALAGVVLPTARADAQRWDGSYTDATGVIFRWRIVPARPGERGDRGVAIQVENPTSNAFRVRFNTAGRLTSGAPGVSFGGPKMDAEYDFGIVPPRGTFVQWYPVRFVVPASVTSAEVVPARGEEEFKRLFHNIPCRQPVCGDRSQVDDVGRTTSDYSNEIARARFEWLTTGPLTAEQRQVAEAARAAVVAQYREWAAKAKAHEVQYFQDKIGFLESVRLAVGGARAAAPETPVSRPRVASAPRGDTLPREIVFKTRAEREEEARVRAADERLRREADSARKAAEEQRRRAYADSVARDSIRRAPAEFAARAVLNSLPAHATLAQPGTNPNPWAARSNEPPGFLESWAKATATNTALKWAFGELPPGPVKRAVDRIVETLLPKTDPSDPLSANAIIRNFAASVSKYAATSWLYEQSVQAGALKTGDAVSDQAERVLSAARLHNLGFGLKQYMSGIATEGSKIPQSILDMLAVELP